MIRYKELLTLKVINKRDSECLGKVSGVLYSDDYKSITHIIIRNNNLIKNKAKILYKDLSFYDDSENLILKKDKKIEYELERDIKNEFKYISKEIKFKNGESIGYIIDIIINIENGFVEGFIITEGIIEDLIKGRNYLPLFKKTIIEEDCIYITKDDFDW